MKQKILTLTATYHSTCDNQTPAVIVVVRHKLSKKATNDLLYIVNLVCLKPNNCCTTVYKFKKLFSGLQLPTVFHY